MNVGGTAVTNNAPGERLSEDAAKARAARLLDAWTALEVLSPQTFREPEDLLTAHRSQVVSIDNGRLYWRGDLRGRPDRRPFHHVLLGELQVQRAFQALGERFPTEGIDLPSVPQSAILGVVVCNEHGVPNPESIALSSFAWGLPVALQGRLRQLADWTREEGKLTKEVRARICRKDEEGEPLALTHDVLMDLHKWLVKELGLADDFVRPPTFFLREFVYRWYREPADSLLLNSFFLAELGRARELLAEGRAPTALRRYLGAVGPAAPRNVLKEPELFADLLAPQRTPLGRWPSAGRKPLVALQQAAVNATLSSAPGDLIAVNGPPGTGKTTLLRDVVAAVVTSRAEVLATFDQPEKAFSRTGVTLSRSKAKLELRAISPKLHGFEVVVASSNNKAVENVSAELPSLGSITDELPDLRYFSSVATALRGAPSWGLVAAVMGNAANVNRFFDTFWSDEDSGLETYLAAAAGTPRSMVDAMGKARAPAVVTEEKPPANVGEARARWAEARRRFLAVVAECRTTVEGLQQAHMAEVRVAQVGSRCEEHDRRRDTIKAEQEAAAAGVGELEVAVQGARSRAQACERELDQYLKGLPRGLARLVQGRRDPESKARETALRAQLAESRGALRTAENVVAGAQQAHQELSERSRQLEGELIDEAKALAAAQNCLAGISLTAPTGMRLSLAPHAERHLGTPWFDANSQAKRDEVFQAAIQLHRAFIDAAAEPIRHNLAALKHHLWRPIGDGGPREIRDLWATFALVVPLFSTTFASVERMFRTLAPGALGWLLIDEAGQATPQAAVGGILRSDRVLVVGDPMQVEPVVTLPETFIASLCEHFELSAGEDVAPAASSQTFADRASPVVATFEVRDGTRTVGLPLLVHRRCAEPMFGISNALAYENLMVQATPPRESSIGAVLRESCWYHVEGTAAGHWCPEEGDVLLRMLRRLQEAGVPPDLYVITPFRRVAQRARDLLRHSPDLRAFPLERVGTIHTVQGREADAVVLLLGAPELSQLGARRWAGGRPNLLNVAVTRAKERIYVVGNHDLWGSAGCFAVLSKRLPRRNVQPRASSGPTRR
jgi:hypothetical protein